MPFYPAIVVCAFDRPASLLRLLGSLKMARYENAAVELIISIDSSWNTDVLTVAEDYIWEFGNKRIIQRHEHLGLKNHILACGDLTEEYDSIILLEDDLLVSPFFYSYAQKAADFYKDDAFIGGISLYNYQVAESCFYPFKALDDGSDVYFMQIASSWGQLWTKKQWKGFRTWFEQNPELPAYPEIPQYLHHWGAQSWKRHFIHYLIDTKRFFVFPRNSFSTNLDESGTNSSISNIFNVPLQISTTTPRFQTIEKSGAIYDAWFEMLPTCLNRHCKILEQFDYTVDLYGSKVIEGLKSKYILTSQKSKEPLLSYDWSLFPLETNILLNSRGKQISLFEISGKSFVKEKLDLINHLDIQNNKKKFGVSIVIPIVVFDAEALRRSLDSVVAQELKLKECVLVCRSENYSAVKLLLKEFDLRSRIIISEENARFLENLRSGVEKANFEIITWIYSGSIFSEKALLRISLLFETHQYVNWIRGIGETISYDTEYANVDVGRYRLNLNLAMKLLKKKHLEDSLELNFITKYHLLRELNFEKRSVTDLFLGLISSNLLTACAYNFGISSVEWSDNGLSYAEFESLRIKYANSEKRSFFDQIFVNIAVNLLICTKKHSMLAYFYLSHFRDVLRFDPFHQTFYHSRR